MHEWLLKKVILPTILAMCELCEKHGISFVCHIELKQTGEPANDFLTHAVQSDSSQQIKNTLLSAEGKLN